MPELVKNGFSLSSIIEKLLIAAVVGIIAVYGNYKVVESEFRSLCKSVDKLESTAEYLKGVVGTLQIKDAQHDYQIDGLDKRLRAIDRKGIER